MCVPPTFILWVLAQQKKPIPTYFDRKYTQKYAFSETWFLKIWKNVILYDKGGFFLPKMQVFLQQTLAYICTSPSNLYICQGFKMIFNARVKLLINKITRIAKGIALIYINFWWISSSVLFIIYLFIFDYISHFGSILLWLTFYLIVGSN